MCRILYAYSSLLFFFFFKQKTAYEMRISDWSSDVCSSDLATAKLLYSARTRSTTVWMPPSISISAIITLNTSHTTRPGCLCVSREKKFEEAIEIGRAHV